MRTIREMLDLTGRVALVTGGSGHVGSVVAHALAECGAAVAIADLSLEDSKMQARTIQQQTSAQSSGYAINLADDAALRAFPEVIGKDYHRLDILVQSAAYVGTTGTPGWAVPFAEQSTEAWDRAMRVNLTSAFVLSQAFGDLLRESKNGSIVFIGSIYGMVGPDWRLYDGTAMSNPAGYAASKGGLLQLTRYLATTLAPQIRVNMVSPGGILRGQPKVFQEKYTERTPLRRMGREEDMKGAVVYLASDMARYVTGVNLPVDGGWTAW
jgi:NAD(P)-dependent dehydrogenase (short-subunit alcohol dehydrogenase family)